MTLSLLKRCICGILSVSLLFGLAGCVSEDLTTIPEGAAVAAFHKISDRSALQLAAVSKLEEGNFCIAKNGVAKATIIVAENAPEKVTAAADDLAAHLKILTGADFTIVTDGERVKGNVILVGESKKTQELEISFPDTYPGNEMFRIIAAKNTLVLGGNDAGAYCGTKFAVTYLLEAFGFGWFSDTELWDIKPEVNGTAFVAGCDIASQSCFSSRYTRLCNYDKALTERWFVGGEVTVTDHMMYYYLPRSMYAEHPDYFAYSNGTRDPEGKQFFQPCLSNPDVQELVAQEVIKYFNEHPDCTVASIGQQDGCDDPTNPDYANWCECDDCKAFAPDFTQSLMKFANIVGKKIKESCPGKRIMFYGYWGTFTAPIDMDFQAEDNVVMMLCKEGGLTRIISEGNLFNEYLNQPQFKENFERWKNYGYEMAIYEWNCPGANDEKWQNTFWIQGDVFLENLKWFKDQGVTYLCVDQTSLPYYEREEDFMGLRWPLYYMSARSMWDCGLNFRDIMLPACKKLFGSAGNYMFTFYSILNQCNRHCEAPSFRWSLPAPNELYTDPSYLADADIAINDALAQAQRVGGDVLKRVQNQYDNWQISKTYITKES